MASDTRRTRGGNEPRALAMIGVIAHPGEHNVVREFFELFKTPWEFYRPDQKYDVVLCAADGRMQANAKLVIFYAGMETGFDKQEKIQTVRQQRHACVLLYEGDRIPIYGDTITFAEIGSSLLTEEDSRECAAFIDGHEEGILARIGYDLFSEVRTLLTVGQPAANARMPALELHIAFLRNLITGCGIPLVEIPPVPDGFRFIACLTHDVDHPSIRQHKWDHTIFGFLHRAIFGSVRNLIRGRISGRDLLTNWLAALRLPFVYLGLAKDFWLEFDDRYLELEGGLPSTFFVIPSRDYSGRNSNGPAPKLRAAQYEAQNITGAIRKLMGAGCEVGLHGIDAWLDSSKGRDELGKIRSLTGNSQIGVRMHWLYYDPQSPTTLEAAGATYDSTIGYNETVGYRAGTMQVYKPLDATRLLELPLHAMDTALFYPSYLDLSAQQARVLLGEMVDNGVKFGGALTINWHDRSIAPERLWEQSYRDLIKDLKSRGAWFATAGDAVSWFDKRRSATFETDSIASEGVGAKVAIDHSDVIPGLRLRIYKARKPSGIRVDNSVEYTEVTVDERIVNNVPSEARR
jgi:peptidoglycan/xylan/chitin deacetylase (PgdA/CDA1 family)